MNKKSLVLLIIGFLLLIVAFIISSYNIIKLIFLLVGIILCSFGVFANYKNYITSILVFLFLLIASYGIDTFLFYKFDKIPIYVYEVSSSDKVKVYNSLFYRIFDCNGSLILDYGYKKNYVCDNLALDQIDINEFLSDFDNIYEKYNNKFVKITGKISKISGNDYLELNSYTFGENKLNGYVNFNSNYIVRVNVNENLSKYRIYDDITVIGRLESMKVDNGIFIFDLVDSKLIATNVYDTFEYEVINSDNKDLISFVNLQNYYLYGINSIYLKYSNDMIYELNYLITDDRITLDDILKNANSEEILRNEEGEIVANKYTLEKFNVLVCNNDKKIIANKDYNLSIELCDN